MKKLYALMLALLLCNANAQVLGSKFDTRNHPKAKGVWATVRYPTGWTVKEGERPNIVQKFTGEYSGMFVVLALQILDAGGPVEKECSAMSTNDFAEAFSDKPNGQVAYNVKKTSHEEKPAFIYDIQSKLERAGISFTTSNRVMTVCYKKTLISAWCSPSVIDVPTKSMTSTARELNLAQPLCFQYFNSLVLMDKY